jgi:hypothetical protein
MKTLASGLVGVAIVLLILDMTSACAQATETSVPRGESIVEQMNPQMRQFPAVRHQRLKSDAIEYAPAVQRPAVQVA